MEVWGFLDREFDAVSGSNLFDCTKDFYHWIFLTLKEGISTKFEGFFVLYNDSSIYGGGLHSVTLSTELFDDTPLPAVVAPIPPTASPPPAGKSVCCVNNLPAKHS